MTLVLAATVIAFVIARQDADKHQAARKAIEAQRNAAPDLQSLASEIHDLRQEVDQENIAEEVLENRWFEVLGFIGTGVIASSFYVESYRRRSKKA